ncbi:MAG TPA: molybdopterin-synthase adenylyltransferase MoeB [Acidimicrobiia bacterium]|nr:molybdopterin-synthase adenylyltransferase MoeB [Acidimicrobiia bacterium]
MDPHDILEGLRATVAEVTPAQASGSGALLLDIREPFEFATGVIPGALLVPQDQVPARIAEVAPDFDRRIVVYCATGKRSLFVTKWLGERGYTDVASMAGGIVAWGAEGHPVAPATAAPDGRYARQVMLPGVGEAGQQRLASARVLVVGAGGLGSPVVLYLAGAGVGTLGIVDDDAVEVTNLHRQVAHTTPRVGMSKVRSAALAVSDLNPDVLIEEYQGRLTDENAADLVAGWDVVVDATDDAAACLALNAASVSRGVPLVHGSVYRWEGRVTVFSPPDGPCYRCLFPDASGAGDPVCADAGVSGPVVGVVGAIQATEVLKLLLGVGEPLVGRLLVYDGLAQESTTLAYERGPGCEVCAL